MPNWVWNEITFRTEGDRLEEIFETIRHPEGKKGSISFGKLMPVPDALQVPEGYGMVQAVNAYLSHLLKLDASKQVKELCGLVPSVHEFYRAGEKIVHNSFEEQNFRMSREQIHRAALEQDKTDGELLALGKQYVTNAVTHGAPTWWEWSIRNWGTKWDLDPNSAVLREPNGNRIMFHSANSAPQAFFQKLSKLFPEVEMELVWVSDPGEGSCGSCTYLNGEVIQDYLPAFGSSEEERFRRQVRGFGSEDYCLTDDGEPFVDIEEQMARAQETVVLGQKTSDSFAEGFDIAEASMPEQTQER